jgi:very-short-patch-repair endonuclease
MYNILYQLNIDFETEKSFNWCKYNFKNKDRIGRYDFYFRLNNVEYIIEMDGKQHKEDIKLGNWNSYHEQRYIDEQKELLAREHCIHVIRIDCEKSELNFIKKNILNSRLNNILNLSMVDWISAEEFACDNLIKIICMYKNNNPNLHCTDIGRLFKLDRSTIRKYFKKGQIHGWCEYNPNDYTNNEKRQNKTA